MKASTKGEIPVIVFYDFSVPQMLIFYLDRGCSVRSCCAATALLHGESVEPPSLASAFLLQTIYRHREQSCAFFKITEKGLLCVPGLLCLCRTTKQFASVSCGQVNF